MGVSTGSTKRARFSWWSVVKKKRIWVPTAVLISLVVGLYFMGLVALQEQNIQGQAVSEMGAFKAGRRAELAQSQGELEARYSRIIFSEDEVRLVARQLLSELDLKTMSEAELNLFYRALGEMRESALLELETRF